MELIAIPKIGKLNFFGSNISKLFICLKENKTIIIHWLLLHIHFKLLSFYVHLHIWTCINMLRVYKFTCQIWILLNMNYS